MGWKLSWCHLCSNVTLDPHYIVSSERDHARQTFMAHTSTDRVVSQYIFLIFPLSYGLLIIVYKITGLPLYLICKKMFKKRYCHCDLCEYRNASDLNQFQYPFQYLDGHERFFPTIRLEIVNIYIMVMKGLSWPFWCWNWCGSQVFQDPLICSLSETRAAVSDHVQWVASSPKVPRASRRHRSCTQVHLTSMERVWRTSTRSTYQAHNVSCNLLHVFSEYYPQFGTTFVLTLTSGTSLVLFSETV